MELANPYSPPGAELVEAAPLGEATLADRGTRFGAQFLDGFITGIPAVLVMLGATYGGALLIPGIRLPLANGGAKKILFTLLTVLTFNLVYLAINGWLLATRGQTIGKKLCGIRIVRKDGSLPTLMESYVRRELIFQGFGQIPFAGPLLRIVDVLFIFRANHHCLHDDVAGTKVVKA